MQISIIAQKLNLYTLQGVAVSQGKIVVPTLDGQLLAVSDRGETIVLADLLKADLGVPFGITAQDQDLIVTVSAYMPVHSLVRVQPTGRYAKIVDLSDLSGHYGAPFGVVVYQGDYMVTLSSDVVESTSQLLRVSSAGKAAQFANLTEFGNPFGIAVRENYFVTAQSKGQLLQVSDRGKVSEIVNLQSAGFGIPFNVAVWRDSLVATTNSGLVVQVDAMGKPMAIIDLLKAKFGIPSGIAVNGDDLIVTTNAGYLLKIGS